MIVKGIISSVNTETASVDVILPEYNNVVITPSHDLDSAALAKLKVNDFVLVIVFNNDFADTFLLLPSDAGGDGSGGLYAFTINADGDLILSYEGQDAPDIYINDDGYLIANI